MATIRVYELAKEMDMNSKVLLDTMIEMGLPMKNHMSTIPGNEVNRIKAMVMKYLGDPNAEPIPRPAEKKEKPPLSGLKVRPRGAEPGQFREGRGGDSGAGGVTGGTSVTGAGRSFGQQPGQQPGQGRSRQGGPRPGGSGISGAGGGGGISGGNRTGGAAVLTAGTGTGARTRQPGESISPQAAQAAARSFADRQRGDGPGTQRERRGQESQPGAALQAGQGRNQEQLRPQGGAGIPAAGPATGGSPDSGQSQSQAQGQGLGNIQAAGSREQSQNQGVGGTNVPAASGISGTDRAAGAPATGGTVAAQRPERTAPVQGQSHAQTQGQNQNRAQGQGPGQGQSQEQGTGQGRSYAHSQGREGRPAVNQAGRPGQQPGQGRNQEQFRPQSGAGGPAAGAGTGGQRPRPGFGHGQGQGQGQTQSQGQGRGQGYTQGQGQSRGQGYIQGQGQGPGRGPGQGQSQQGPGQNRGAGQGQNRGAGQGQTASQARTDKYARPQQGQGQPQKPRRPQGPVDNRQKGFNKGPKAPTIGKDTADQLTHLGSAAEEDSRFLNKVENAVGEKAYERGGIAKTPGRKPGGRFEDSRNNRARGRGRDRGRPVKQEPLPVVIKNITLDGPTTVTEFARLLGRKTGDIIKKLISLGVMASINQELDLDTLMLLGQEFGTQVEARVTKEEILIAADEPDLPENLKERPPVVTIMGHVDHGKTSLLDAIRQANVQASEAGGITQHIGAYQVEINGRKITFLDTPGHEAFTAMRARGAQCTDIAILVVAADDGVMPQTVEAINHAKGANVPVIVAVNKIDKEGANPERVKQELTEYGLLTEDWGGDTVFAEVSAKTKQGIDHLLEMILLVADVGDLKANADRKAKGVVIEAKLDKGRGPVATVLVQNGTLETGDFLIAGTAQGRIRAMNDERGRQMKTAGPSTPAEIVGLSEVPQAGDMFQVVADERLAKQIASERTAVKREEVIHSRNRISLDDLFAQIQTGEVKDLNIIIKADVQGSIEALKSSLEKLSNDEVRVQTIHQAVGGITEADVDFASASNAIILGFNVRPDVNAKKAAEANQVDIRLYRVIYNAIEDVKSALSGLLKPEIRESVIGRAEVRQIIRVPKMGAVAGSYILEGKITRGCQVRVIRDNIVIFEGNLGSLRRFKDDVKEVATGFECGIGIDRFNDFQEGDNIEGFIMEEIKRELT